VAARVLDRQEAQALDDDWLSCLACGLPFALCECYIDL
jgi:hypothetical protein